MKTSDKLLVVLLIGIIAGLIGTNISLKAEYEQVKIHPKPTEGFQFVETSAFSHVRINSQSAGVNFYIQEGNQRFVEVNQRFKGKIKTRVQNDTLLVDLPEVISLSGLSEEEKRASEIGMFISGDQLHSISFENGSGNIKHILSEDFTLDFRNSSAGIVYDTSMDTLHIRTHDKSSVTFHGGNQIKKLYYDKLDESQINIDGIFLQTTSTPLR